MSGDARVDAGSSSWSVATVAIALVCVLWIGRSALGVVGSIPLLSQALQMLGLWTAARMLLDGSWTPYFRTARKTIERLKATLTLPPVSTSPHVKS